MKIVRTFLICTFTLLQTTPLALAHKHSWYDWSCCNDQDCGEAVLVKENVVHGRVVSRVFRRVRDGATAEVGINFKTKVSGDNQWHICLNEAGVICLYQPTGV